MAQREQRGSKDRDRVHEMLEHIGCEPMDINDVWQIIIRLLTGFKFPLMLLTYIVVRLSIDVQIATVNKRLWRYIDVVIHRSLVQK